MAPVVLELRKGRTIDSRVLVSGQHRERLDQVLDVFQIDPDYDLGVICAGQSPVQVLARVLFGMQSVLHDYSPGWVSVQGDTTTVPGSTMAAAMVGCRVGHIEAGPRTYDRRNPCPEELNRVQVDHASDLRRALLCEGAAEARACVTGHNRRRATGFRSSATSRRPFTLAAGTTPDRGHPSSLRNQDLPLTNILAALQQLAPRPDVQIDYPVHRNPNIWGPAHELLAGLDNVSLPEPLDDLALIP